MTTTAQTLVLAIFDDEAGADAAAKALVDWVKAEDVVRRPIGVLALDDAGRIKEHKLGRKRSGAKGAGIGAVLAVVAPPTLLAGAVAGGVIGHFHHEGLKLSEAERQRIAGELVGGKAAVGTLVEEEAEAHMLMGKLRDLGGRPEVHEITDEAIAAAEDHADAPPLA
jgi:hypothetical protein